MLTAHSKCRSRAFVEWAACSRGDVGSEEVLTELEAIAPVRAVLGNTDLDMCRHAGRFCGHRFCCHIVDVDLLRARNMAEVQDFVVFGHTHAV